MIPFILANFTAIMVMCVLAFIGGIVLVVVGKSIQSRGNKKLRYHLARMTEEERQAFFIEHGYFDIR